MLRSVAILALVSSVSAFFTIVPSLAPSSRRVGTSPAAGSLRMTVDSVEERLTEKQKGGPYKTVRAPDITLFDNVGCARKNLEYKGKKSGTDDDERCVKVEMTPVFWSEVSAEDQESQVWRGFSCMPRPHTCRSYLVLSKRI